MDDGTESNTNCSMTGMLGIIIQLALGILSFSVLIIKRFREKPRRAWKIWIFDTSKQLISQLLAHFINLTISIALSYNDDTSDQCLWYFTTNILDNTLGVLICVACLRGIEWSLKRRGKMQFISGNYYSRKKVVVEIEIMDAVRGEIKDIIDVGVSHDDEYQKKGQMHEQRNQSNEPEPDIIEATIDDSRVQTGPNATQEIQKYNINYQAWLVQLLIWVSVVVIGKSVLFGFEYGLKNPLKSFTFLIMGWIENYPVFELIVVIVLVPVVMNGLAFWIQDNFLMKKEELQVDGENPLIQEQSTQREPNMQL